MSGRKQHYIPQSLLRGFQAPQRGRARRIWVFTKEKSLNVSIRDAAAQRDFYSRFSVDGSETLDDRITLYENDFATRLASLRETPANSHADSLVSAEVIAHLIIRNAHIRNTFTSAMTHLVDGAVNVFCNEENLGRILGFDTGKMVSGTFFVAVTGPERKWCQEPFSSP